MDGALDAWAAMLNAGFNPRICSKSMDENPTCREDKFDFLETHFVPRFGPTVIDRAILTGDKAVVDAIALIDDKPNIDGAGQARWQHIVFGRPYNAHILDRPRLESWRDNRLGALLLQAQGQYLGEVYQCNPLT
jgi:5'-nucleotidase